jgi:hypothetical protein
VASARAVLVKRIPANTLNDIDIISALPGGFPIMGKRKPPVLIAYAFLLRWLRRQDLRKFDYVLSTFGECDVVTGGRQACYVHFPVMPRNGSDAARLGGRLSTMPMVRRAYAALARLISGYQGLAPDTLILCNSLWSRAQIARLTDYTAAVVLYAQVKSFPVPSGAKPPPIRDGAKCIVVGRFEPYKGQEQVVNGLHRAAQDIGSTAVVQFVGRGTAADIVRLKSLETDRVRVEVITDATAQQIGEIIAQAHFAASAFRFEHFGLATAELMASGLPVFVPNDGGQAEIGDDPRFVFGSQDEMVARFKEVITGQVPLETLAKRALERGQLFAANDFSHNLLAEIKNWQGQQQ